MKKNTVKKILCFVLTVIMLFAFAGCNGFGSKKEKLVLQWIQWTGGGTGGGMWDYQTAEAVGVNQLSVYYLGEKEDGETVYGVPTNKQYSDLMEEAKDDIQTSKERGISVIGYSDTVQFAKDSAEAMGIKVEDIVAKNAKGEIVSYAWYKEGLYIACINSPEWRSWLKENVRLTAEAGFAGLQYDFHPYAAASLFCICDNCTEKWAKRSKEVFGEEMEIPTGLNFSTEKSREYYQWKMDCFCEFMKETGSEAKKINSDFLLIMNNNANGYNFAFEALGDGWPMPTSEHASVNNGYSSGLYIYQMAEALGYNDLYSQYGSEQEIDPVFRYKVNIGESFGTIGGISYAVDNESAGLKAFTFANKNPEPFINNESIAKTAVLWSVESNLYSLKPNELDLSSLLFNFSTDRARQMASALVKGGVIYDYIALEVEDVLDNLKKYDVFVLPAYTYFDEETWKPVLAKISELGKKIIVVGDEAKAFVTEQNTANCTFVPEFIYRTAERNLKLSDEFKQALEDTGATGQVVIENNLDVTAVSAREGSEALYVHVIRRGGDENVSDLTTKLTVELPEGFKLADVKADCIFKDGKNKTVDITYTEKDGKVELESGEFDTYLLITLSKK